MRNTITHPIVWILLLLLRPGMTDAEPAPPSEDLKRTITYLLDTVVQSGCTFIRNGKSHTSKEAAEHMKVKYENFKKEIHTPEDFIRLTATKSVLTGQLYRVRTKDGKEVKSADWLSKALEDYRKTRKELEAEGK